jgi:hypothetical protein
MLQITVSDLGLEDTLIHIQKLLIKATEVNKKAKNDYIYEALGSVSTLCSVLTFEDEDEEINKE